MKKLVGMLVLCLLLVGCSQPSMPTAPMVPEAPSGHSIKATPAEPKSPEIDRIEPPTYLVDRVWISPGKVHVGNFHSGARAEWILTIHNGHSFESEFSVVYTTPGHVEEGYVAAPKVVQEWVIIADPTPVIVPKGTEDYLIVLAMPEDAPKMPAKFEFWITVTDMSQVGTVTTSLGCRWLVSMRVE